jgi:crossover junction endodeoxyribonuclease RuvC
MIILGIDPGTLVTGYGVIESRNGTVRMISCGAVKNPGSASMPARLKRIFEAINGVIEEHHPDEFAIETAFYGKNAQSALKLGHARGVAILCAILRGIPTHEYSPREVKKAVVGRGNASKQQVQYMVKSFLHLTETPPHLDITDALAVSLCHLNRRVVRGKQPFTSWKAFLAAHPERVSSGRQR